MSVIDKAHRDFAKALVSLAREHNMDRLNVTFQKSFNHPDRPSPFFEPVEMTWQEGRHMAAGNITLCVRSTITETVQ